MPIYLLCSFLFLVLEWSAPLTDIFHLLIKFSWSFEASFKVKQIHSIVLLLISVLLISLRLLSTHSYQSEVFVVHLVMSIDLDPALK